MKGTLALLLIAAGLYIVYEVINGGATILSGNTTGNDRSYTFTPAASMTPDQVGTANMGTRATGGAIPPANVPFIPPPLVGPGETPKDPSTGQPVGGNMVSIQSRVRRIWE